MRVAMQPLNPSSSANESLSNTPADDVLNLLEQVESQFERIRELRRAQDNTVQSLASRSEELDAREMQIDARQARQQAEHDAAIEQLRTQADRQLDAIVAARQSVARRGRRLQHLETVTRRSSADRDRLRRRLRGLRHAVRRLLKDGQRLQESARAGSEQYEQDQRTIKLQNERLRLATEKMRHFSSLLMEQTERLEQGSAAIMEVDALRAELEASRMQQQALQAQVDVDQAATPPIPTTCEDTQGLKRRRKRLQRCRQLLQDRARRLPQMAQLEATRRRQETQLLDQQRHLDEVRRVLAATETRMIRKWAAARATQIIGWAGLLTLLIGCGSWWAANRWDPPIRRATISMTAASPDGAPLESHTLDAWHDWHTGLLATAPFAKRFAARLQERGVSNVNSAESVRGFLSDGIHIDQAIPGRLTMSTTMAHGVDWLDAMALVMSTESARTVRSRPGPVVAKIEGRHLDDGRVQYATYDSIAVSDTRLQTAMVIFIGSALACLLIGIVLYVHLARVRHVLDDSITESTAMG